MENHRCAGRLPIYPPARSGRSFTQPSPPVPQRPSVLSRAATVALVVTSSSRPSSPVCATSRLANFLTCPSTVGPRSFYLFDRGRIRTPDSIGHAHVVVARRPRPLSTISLCPPANFVTLALSPAPLTHPVTRPKHCTIPMPDHCVWDCSRCQQSPRSQYNLLCTAVFHTNHGAVFRSSTAHHPVVAQHPARGATDLLGRRRTIMSRLFAAHLRPPIHT